MKYQRAIPIITPLIIWLLNELFLAQPALFNVSWSLGLLVIVLSVRLVTRRRPLFWLAFLTAPVLFFLSLAFYAATIINPFWIQLIFLLIVWFLFFYLRDLYYYAAAVGTEEEQTRWAARLENLLIAGSVLAVWAAAAVLFDLPVFVNWPIYFLLPVWAVIVGLSLAQFKAFKAAAGTAGRLWLVLVLLLVELLWALTWWPFNYNILALFAVFAYYLALLIMRLAASDNLNRRALKLPLILGALAMLLLFLTSRWL